MATHKLYNAYFVFNSVNLSDHVKAIELPQGCESLDDTFMGDTFRSNAGGLLTWSIKVTLGQDYASGSVDATLSPLVGSTAAFELRADAGSVSTTNPKWTGTALVTGYKPVGGTVGELHITELELAAASACTRATS